MHSIEKVAKLQSWLGEGACWDVKAQALWSVDILGKRLFRTDVQRGTTRHWDMPCELGAALPRELGGLVLCLRKGFALFDPSSASLEWRLEMESDRSRNRFNDAAVDPLGRIWAGTMDFDAIHPTGALYKLDTNWNCTRMDDGYVVTNGPAFSPDSKTMYHNDTMRGVVYAFDFDLESGAISRRRELISLPPHAGLSDGITVDRGGDLWLCQVTAGRIGRYGPDGRLKQTIALPVPMVTSCCFGGADFSTLYITTARILLSPPELLAYPDSGDLYSIQTDTCGIPCVEFKG